MNNTDSDPTPHAAEADALAWSLLIDLIGYPPTTTPGDVFPPQTARPTEEDER
ncbi:hypothetical protein [Streptomyces cylindrosporus]|uniref:Uracil-DNA glycosylase n=1 Tax=Streptomyces cylindrosporus TaxID=2927583 RepID=A0ABS9Y246_9ACTN|nr:hypothetical protein [Streptomyces cylindrosporus]MCI3271287.1 hypothetical protein [Streptomyces cylindrosporus]